MSILVVLAITCVCWCGFQFSNVNWHATAAYSTTSNRFCSKESTTLRVHRGFFNVIMNDSHMLLMF